MSKQINLGSQPFPKHLVAAIFEHPCHMSSQFQRQSMTWIWLAVATNWLKFATEGNPSKAFNKSSLPKWHRYMTYKLYIHHHCWETFCLLGDLDLTRCSPDEVVVPSVDSLPLEPVLSFSLGESHDDVVRRSPPPSMTPASSKVMISWFDEGGSFQYL